MDKQTSMGRVEPLLNNGHGWALFFCAAPKYSSDKTGMVRSYLLLLMYRLLSNWFWHIQYVCVYNIYTRD